MVKFEGLRWIVIHFNYLKKAMNNRPSPVKLYIDTKHPQEII